MSDHEAELPPHLQAAVADQGGHVSEYRVGDVVDVEIQGARVVETGLLSLDVTHDGISDVLTVEIANPAITITRCAPKPQAGEVWAHPQYGRRMVIQIGAGVTLANLSEAPAAWTPIDRLDWGGWVRAYPPADPNAY